MAETETSLTQHKALFSSRMHIRTVTNDPPRKNYSIPMVSYGHVTFHELNDASWNSVVSTQEGSKHPTRMDLLFSVNPSRALGAASGVL